jgi:type IV pilus biogenesis protein CpaD/CtpE
MRFVALALLVACGSDQPAAPPASPPPPPPTVALAVDAAADATVADAGVDASYAERLRELRQEQDDMRKRLTDPPFVMPKRDRVPRETRQECLDNPLAKGC